MPATNVSPKQLTLTEDAVRLVTERLCGDTLAVIRTLRPEDQGQYREALLGRTRNALEEAAARYPA